MSLARAEGPQRLSALRRSLDIAGLDAVIVSDPVSIHHLTGFGREAFGVLVVEHDSARLVTVTGFAAEAQGVAAGVDVALVNRGIWGRVSVELTARMRHGCRIGFQSEHLTHAMFTALSAAVAPVAPELVAADLELAMLRATKSPAELELLRAAAAPLAPTFAWICEQPLAGLTERELARRIERRLQDEHGVEGLAFDTVVAAGPHGAAPHHSVTDAPIAAGELLVLDVGCVVDGYRSDMTRTIAVGGCDDTSREIYELVAEARRAALATLAPGVAAEAVHEAAAGVIAGGGHGERFIHGLGHGIGLDLHELPFAEPGAVDPLAAGHVLTVEPGIYLPDRLGVRIEDEVVVTDSGYELLTSAPVELITCG